MSRSHATQNRLPKGVVALSISRGGRGFRASIRRGKVGEVHLGLYETSWLAAFAYEVAARLLSRNDAPRIDIPLAKHPSAEQVHAITAKVRRRLGLDRSAGHRDEIPPGADDMLTLFEVAVLGFWRAQAAGDSWGQPGAGLDAAGRQLAEAARLLFWSRALRHPTPLEVLTRLLGRRLDSAFRRSDVTGAILDDDGDDEWRIARWLIHPDGFPDSRARGFRDEIRHLYPDLFDDGVTDGPTPAWASVLNLDPPYTWDRVRAAYRARSLLLHPDVGGSNAQFVRLQAAYEDARLFCESRSS